MHSPMIRRKPTMIRISEDPDAAVWLADNILRQGSVIAVPTDTIYGLAVSAQHSGGVNTLYDIKQRDEQKPVAICVSEVSEVSNWGETSHLPKGILEALLPGPVTVVLRRKLALNNVINPGNPLVGIRVPNDNFIREICSRFGQPIALTSANRSSVISSLDVSEFQELWPLLGAVFDGGRLPGSRSGSTVVDLSVPRTYSILREGSALNETIARLHEHGISLKQ